MDFIEIEKGYSRFYKTLLRILRAKDLQAFLRHIAGHPREAGRLSHCLGLSREMAEVEMYKVILRFKNLWELHGEAQAFLESKGVSLKDGGNRAFHGKKRRATQRAPRL